LLVGEQDDHVGAPVGGAHGTGARAVRGPVGAGAGVVAHAGVPPGAVWSWAARPWTRSSAALPSTRPRMRWPILPRGPPSGSMVVVSVTAVASPGAGARSQRLVTVRASGGSPSRV